MRLSVQDSSFCDYFFTKTQKETRLCDHMNQEDFEKINEELRQSRYKNNEYYNVTIKKLNEILSIYESLSVLITLNGFVFAVHTSSGVCFLHTELLESSTKTLESIEFCIENGSLSDAYILIRKFQDQSMMFLYFLEIVKKSTSIEQDPNQHIKNFFDWYHGKISFIKIGEIFSYLKADKDVFKILKEYQLESEWNKLRSVLNDHIHVKGRKNALANYSPHYEYEAELKRLSEYLDHITVTFISTLIMINPTLTMATDYVDYLDFGMKPPDGSQYTVAPVISSFINNYVKEYNNDLVKHIKNNSIMNFE